MNLPATKRARQKITLNCNCILFLGHIKGTKILTFFANWFQVEDVGVPLRPSPLKCKPSVVKSIEPFNLFALFFLLLEKNLCRNGYIVLLELFLFRCTNSLDEQLINQIYYEFWMKISNSLSLKNSTDFQILSRK